MESLFQTDWRLKDRPWEYLYGARLSWVRTFRPYRSAWDHEHCSFCFSSISAQPEDLHSGYCTTDVEPSKEDWICEKCYQDFHALFGWTVKSYPALFEKELLFERFDLEQTGKEFTRCVLCLARMGAEEDSIGSGYRLPETDEWICPACYHENKEEH